MNAKNIFRNMRGLAMSALLLIPAAFVSCSDDDTEGGSPYFRLENTVVSSKLVTASSDLGFDAEAIIGDATDLDALVGERTFDRVFIDSPCTGLGTLRRHADIRWRLRPETIAESAELDARLLESAASHVAPGGILAYATCTVTHEENADAVEAFLATEAGAAFEVVPCRNPDLDIELPFFSTVLEPDGPDAHFLALLRRKA